MISKAQAKFIKSLQLKKYRTLEQCFVVEGGKSVLELLRSDFQVTTVAATSEFLATHPDLLSGQSVELLKVTASQLAQMGSLQSNDQALAIARMKPGVPPLIGDSEYVVMLDALRDPGNVGTIIRTCDWFGIRKIIASSDTADFYNPKVIISSMGSFCRTTIFYADLGVFLSQNKLPVYGTLLEGEDVHSLTFKPSGIIVVGNESRGISDEVKPYITDRITIPGYGGAESLNAGIATGIVLDNLRRLKK